MVYLLLGATLGYGIGALISEALFGAKKPVRRPLGPPVKRAGNPDAAFLLMTLTVFGGMAAGGLLGL